MTGDSVLGPEASEHYATGYEATRLLGSPHGELERVRSQEIIARHLPRPSARVLDIGGAAGVYSLWLLDQGYEVHLIDALPLHAELAAKAFGNHPQHGLASASVGDARSLQIADQSADAALLMGPLYHLTERSDRVKALREARRVVRPGGLVVAAAISRWASLLDGLARNLIDDPVFREILKGDLDTGQHRNPSQHADYFTTAFFHRPDEFRGELEEAGLAVDCLVAVEGPAWLLGNLSDRMTDAARRTQLLGLLRIVEREPALIGISAHWLAVARSA